MKKSILFIGLIATLFMLISLTGIYFLYQYSELSNDVGRIETKSRLVSFGIVISQSIKDNIDKTKLNLEIISSFDEVKNGSGEECSAKLKELYNSVDFSFSNIGRMDSDGIFRCSVQDEVIGFDGRQYPFLQNIIIDPNHSPVLARALPYDYGSGQQILMPLHIPLFDENGKFKGSLGSALNLSLIKEERFQKFNSEKTHAFLIDDDFTILIHEDSNIIGTNLFEHTENEELVALTEHFQKNDEHPHAASFSYYVGGEEFISTHQYIEMLPGRNFIIVLSEKPERGDILSRRNYYFQSFGGIIILIALAGTVLITFAIIQVVFKPIEEINSTVTKISKGNFDVEINEKIISREDEVGELAKSLSRVLSSLKLAVMKAGVSKYEMGIGEAVKAKEVAEEKFAAIFENVADGIFLIRTENGVPKFIDANKSAVKMMGLKSKDDIIGKAPIDISEKVQPGGIDSKKRILKDVRSAIEGKNVIFEWVFKKKNGKKLVAEVSLNRINLSNKEYIVAIVRDLTERKESEKSLRKRTEELERFATLSIGREQKMMELKAKIKELEDEIWENENDKKKRKKTKSKNRKVKK